MNTYWLKITVFVISIMLLCMGVAVWLAGWSTRNPERKHLGAKFLSAWLTFDFFACILAWILGWFTH